MLYLQSSKQIQPLKLKSNVALASKVTEQQCVNKALCNRQIYQVAKHNGGTPSSSSFTMYIRGSTTRCILCRQKRKESDETANKPQ